MVDFIFYTDCPLPKHRYKNTIFHQCSYENYCQLISTKLGISYENPHPYKLTDLKPFIGFIHQEELRDYDFWGMGDLDLVYGNLSMIINDSNMDRYDVITTHNYHIAAHCCFCRKTTIIAIFVLRLQIGRGKLQMKRPCLLTRVNGLT